jgi:hypothetical protein
MGRLVVVEELPPRVVNRVLVLQILLVELVHEPLVRAEVPHGAADGGWARHGGIRLFLSLGNGGKKPKR